MYVKNFLVFVFFNLIFLQDFWVFFEKFCKKMILKFLSDLFIKEFS